MIQLYIYLGSANCGTAAWPFLLQDILSRSMYFALMSLDNSSNNTMTSTVLCVTEREKCSVVRSFLENNRDEINLLSYSRNESYSIFWHTVYTYFVLIFFLMFSCSGIFLKQVLKVCVSERTYKAAFWLVLFINQITIFTVLMHLYFY